MLMPSPNVRRVIQAIAKFTTEEQRAFLSSLPQVLKIPWEDILWLKLAESAFAFWNNEEDAIYDTL